VTAARPGCRGVPYTSSDAVFLDSVRRQHWTVWFEALNTPEWLSMARKLLVVVYSRSNYREVIARLPDLLRRLQCVADAQPQGERRERGYSMLTLAYGKALATLFKLGSLDLAGIATERARWAASQSGDPLWAAIAEFTGRSCCCSLARMALASG
jgi:hypothetical protein